MIIYFFAEINNSTIQSIHDTELLQQNIRQKINHDKSNKNNISPNTPSNIINRVTVHMNSNKD